MIERRGFLKMLGALGASTGLVTYAEPLMKLAPVRHEWIEDRGDFVIIRVPDYKSFAHEVIEKPAIMFLGYGAAAEFLEFRSYLNVDFGQGSWLRHSEVDTTRSRTELQRSTLRMRGRNGRVEYCCFKSGPSDKYSIEVEEETRDLQVSEVHVYGSQGIQVA